MVSSWALDGVRPFIYINPYIADLSNFVTDLRQNLYAIGEQNGYFVKNKDGQTYLIKSVSIEFATVDFTNPAARDWIIWEMEHQWPCEWSTILFSLIHKLNLVVSQLSMNISKLFEELEVLNAIVDLSVVRWPVGRMRTHDHIRKGVHFNPSKQKSLRS